MRSSSNSSRDRAKHTAHGKLKAPHVDWPPGAFVGPGGQYEVLELLGDGGFGRVLSCRCHRTQTIVAVKVSRDQRKAWRQHEKEAAVLEQLRSIDSALCQRFFNCLLDKFTHDETHICLVFRPLAVSLQNLLREPAQKGLLMNDIKAIARQLVEGLVFLHSAGLAHTDLKCGNVMLRDGAFDAVAHPRRLPPQQVPQFRQPCEAVVIDFGGAISPANRGKGRPGARQIRAPEVVLSLDWDESADLWALGCVLAAIYRGFRLFHVHADMEQLAVMEQVLEERLPPEMAQRTSERILAKSVTFNREWRLLWPSATCSQEEMERVRGLATLRSQIPTKHDDFHLLLSGLFKMNPRERLTAVEARTAAFIRNDAVTE